VFVFCRWSESGHGVSAEVGHELMAIKQTNPIACRFIPRVHCKAAIGDGKVLLKKKFTQKQLITFSANLQPVP
jgi:hypothetical protein